MKAGYPLALAGSVAVHAATGAIVVSMASLFSPAPSLLKPAPMDVMTVRISDLGRSPPQTPDFAPPSRSQTPVIARAERMADIPHPRAEEKRLPTPQDQAKEEAASSESAHVEAARPSRNPPPDYPTLARRQALEGTVTLQVRILADGRPAEVGVKTSSGHSCLDEAAVKAVREWLFVPARRDGRPVEDTTELAFRFVLQE